MAMPKPPDWEANRGADGGGVTAKVAFIEISGQC